MTLSQVMIREAKFAVLISVFYMLAWIGATYLKGEVEMTTSFLVGKWGVTALSIWIGFLFGHLITVWRVNRRARKAESLPVKEGGIYFLSDKEGK